MCTPTNIMPTQAKALEISAKYQAIEQRARECESSRTIKAIVISILNKLGFQIKCEYQPDWDNSNKTLLFTEAERKELSDLRKEWREVSENDRKALNEIQEKCNKANAGERMAYNMTDANGHLIDGARMPYLADRINTHISVKGAVWQQYNYEDQLAQRRTGYWKVGVRLNGYLSLHRGLI